ncbi:MAG: DUF2238 domain-containing protein [bacterium]|nr:DUF2238 domain-containing protein [bacterium]
MTRNINLPKMLLTVFVIAFVILAISPADYGVWWLENLPVILVLPILIWGYYKHRLSNLAYLSIFVYATLCIFAAHYTFSEAPLGEWLSQLFGWERNHYDRLVHLSYGLLMTPVIWEIFRNYLPKKNWAKAIFVFSIVVALGSLYELAELAAAVIFNPELGLDFVGAQGDVWDAQKDMALQTAGSIMSLMLLGVFKARRLVKAS